MRASCAITVDIYFVEGIIRYNERTTEKNLVIVNADDDPLYFRRPRQLCEAFFRRLQSFLNSYKGALEPRKKKYRRLTKYREKLESKTLYTYTHTFLEVKYMQSQGFRQYIYK